MRYPGGFKLRLLGLSADSPDHGEISAASAIAAETAHGLLRLVAWLLRGESDDRDALPVRVFYKFDSGAWRSRSTRQLHKVYRCR
jgi:hypothetical protein